MLILASDHAGFELKQFLNKFFILNGIDFIDAGALDYDPDDDYPDLADKAVRTVLEDERNFGVFICGSGIGMSMCANRYPGIRAVLAYDKKTAESARLHNNANVLCLGQRRVSKSKALKIILKFVSTKFANEERHIRRLGKF